MNIGFWTGNLTRDPETKVMANNETRTTFTLAVQRPYPNPQSGNHDADFITFVAFKRNAEIAAKYLAKGRRVLVYAHVRTGSYEKEGKKVYTTEFIVDKFEFLPSSTSQTSQGSNEQPAQPESENGFTEVSPDNNPFVDSDSLPF